MDRNPSAEPAERFALTFDDGPGAATEAILDLLVEARVRATFFIVGRHFQEGASEGPGAESARRLLLRALRDGHCVGNHSYSHKLKHRSPGEFAADVRKCDDVIRDARREAGQEIGAPIPFRLPYGIKFNEIAVSAGAGLDNVASALDARIPVLGSLGRSHVHWTSLPGDWLLESEVQGQALALRMGEHVTETARHGLAAVFCLHDGAVEPRAAPAGSGVATVAAVRDFLGIAARSGWESFTVPR